MYTGRLASQIAISSEYVKLYMKILTANRYYALNDRTINMLSQAVCDLEHSIHLSNPML